MTVVKEAVVKTSFKAVLKTSFKFTTAMMVMMTEGVTKSIETIEPIASIESIESIETIEPIASIESIGKAITKETIVTHSVFYALQISVRMHSPL